MTQLQNSLTDYHEKSQRIYKKLEGTEHPAKELLKMAGFQTMMEAADSIGVAKQSLPTGLRHWEETGKATNVIMMLLDRIE